MLKKTFTYLDFDGNVRTEDCYFNLTEAEVTEMEVEHEEGMLARLKAIIDKNDGPAIMKEFKELILKSYGEKSPDGRYHMKSPEIAARFAASPMYSDLYMELIMNPDAASAFINGIVPKEKTEEQKKALSKTNYERIADMQANGNNVVNMPTATPVSE